MANGLTIAEMADKLKKLPDTVKRQLQRKGIKPASYAGPTALYDKSALEAIRNVPGKGRPRKAKTEEKTASKSKKAKK
jgi:IS30 family transposase